MHNIYLVVVVVLAVHAGIIHCGVYLCLLLLMMTEIMRVRTIHSGVYL